MYTCVVTDYVEPDLEWEKSAYAAGGVEFHPLQLRGATVDELAPAVEGADVLIVDQARITGDLLARLPRCKLVIRHGDGYDNLDHEAAADLGIVCVNKPGFWSQEVAELAMTLSLALLCKLPVQQRVARTANIGVGSGWNLGDAMPRRRMGTRSVGILGFGRIGRLMVERILPVAGRTLVCDPFVEPIEIEQAGAEPVTLQELLTRSDLISIHTPATPETTGLFGPETFSAVKPGLLLVNTARGSIVQMDALLEALRCGQVAGAALDVTLPEPLPPDHPLLSLENVIVTPHLGWYSEDALWAIRRSIVSDVIAAKDGNIPSSVVNPSVLKNPGLRLRGPNPR